MGITPFVSRIEESLFRTEANAASLADCFATAPLETSAATADEDSEVINRKRPARCVLAKIYSPTCYSASMILKVDWISTVGRSVAATLQYFVSDNSIA